MTLKGITKEYNLRTQINPKGEDIIYIKTMLGNIEFVEWSEGWIAVYIPVELKAHNYLLKYGCKVAQQGEDYIALKIVANVENLKWLMTYLNSKLRGLEVSISQDNPLTEDLDPGRKNLFLRMRFQ